MRKAFCAAIGYANQRLQGTLGANIVIHPRTRKAIGRKRFNALIAELRYGTVAINCWSRVAFLLALARGGVSRPHSTIFRAGGARCITALCWRKPSAR